MKKKYFIKKIILIFLFIIEIPVPLNSNNNNFHIQNIKKSRCKKIDKIDLSIKSPKGWRRICKNNKVSMYFPTLSSYQIKKLCGCLSIYFKNNKEYEKNEKYRSIFSKFKTKE